MKYAKLFVGIICVITLINLAEPLPAQDQTSSLSLKAVGKVFMLDADTRLGTAFVAGEKRNIFMPAHVAKQDTLYYQPYNSTYMFRISVKFLIPELDLAVYERTGGENIDVYPLGN